MYYGRSKSNFPVASLKRRMKKVVGTCHHRSFYEVYQSLNLIRKKTKQLFPEKAQMTWTHTHTYTQETLYIDIM